MPKLRPMSIKNADKERKYRKHGEVQKVLDKAGIEWVCIQIANGRRITALCEQLGVARSQLIKWCRDDFDRSTQYEQARQDRADGYADEIEDDFHNAKNDFELKKARELAYQKRWYASKIRPAQYGSTVNIDHSGKVDVSDAQLDARIVALGSAISTAIAEATSGGVDGAASGEEEAS